MSLVSATFAYLKERVTSAARLTRQGSSHLWGFLKGVPGWIRSRSAGINGRLSGIQFPLLPIYFPWLTPVVQLPVRFFSGLWRVLTAIPRWTWAAVAQVVKHWVGVLFLLVLIALGFEIHEALDDPYYMGPIDIPPGLAKSANITGHALANRLLDEISRIDAQFSAFEKQQRQDNQSALPMPAWVESGLSEHRPTSKFRLQSATGRQDIHIPALGVSLRAVADWILQKAERLCMPQWSQIIPYARGSITRIDCPPLIIEHERFTGEVDQLDGLFRLTIRHKGTPVTGINDNGGHLDLATALNDAAQVIHARFDEFPPELERKNCDHSLRKATDWAISRANEYRDAGLPRAAQAIGLHLNDLLEQLRDNCDSNWLDATLAKNSYAVGEASWALNEMEEALAAYNKASQLEDDEWTQANIGMAHAQLGNLETAEQRLRRVLGDTGSLDVSESNECVHPSPVPGDTGSEGQESRAIWKTALAEVLSKQRRFAKAEAEFESSACLYPGWVWTWWSWGEMLLLQQNLPDQALAKYERAVQLLPEEKGLLLGNAWALTSLSRYSDASVVARRVLEIDPENNDARILLAEISNLRQRPARAITRYEAVAHDITDQILESALARIPNDQDLRALFAAERPSLSRIGAALSEKQTLTGLTEPLAVPFQGICWSLNKMGRYGEAEAYCRYATHFDPQSPWARSNWGWSLYGRNRFWQAIEKFRESLRVDPYHEDGYTGWALCLHEQNRTDAALAKLELGARALPRTNALDIVRAEILIESRRLAAAGTLLDGLEARDSVTTVPELYGEVLSQLGWIENARGLYTEAERLHWQAVETNEFNMWAWTDLAEDIDRQGFSQYSDLIYDVASRIAPHFAPAFSGWGDTYLRRGRAKEAIARFHQALDLDPYLIDAWIGLARARAASGDSRRAIEHLEHARRLNPYDAEVLVAWGELLAKTASPADAVSMLDKAIALNPVQVEAFLEIGKLQMQLRYSQAAAAAFEEAVTLDPDGIYGQEASSMLRQLRK